MADEPRFPPNLQGLLRFALHYTASEDALQPSTFEEMDPERRKFLEDALKSMTVDVIEELGKSISILENPDASVIQKVEAFNIIQDYTHSIDFANNFIKIGGSKVLLAGLDSQYPELRSSAARLVAELSQNNAYCQKHFLKLDFLPKLVDLLGDVDSVGCSSMHAISCLVRSCEPCMAAFIDIGGIECLFGCLQSNCEKMFIKASFLISAMSSEFPTFRDELIKMDGVEKLIKVLKVPTVQTNDVEEFYDIKLETVLSALNSLTENPDAIQRCQSSNNHLKRTLLRIIKASEGKPESEEILEYSQSLLKKCFTRTSEDTDR